ncbi:MAG: YeeE/YedE thiosulfate transporter family protein [Candidatus Kapabacteria bacterium]|nr:YeeE/YedE thiosulfate transporter family protein [Candidatus Kapabacteria bacterium]
MGPLVPDIIGNELNYVVALLIGIAFGFILEQAGFSTSKKLVGLFYGYDFTVLRVFFTAGVTGMIGVIALGHFGLLDLNLIYVNPTFLWSAIIGGFIMGLGFVIGGFCPGTSFCAAAIGKTDAMVFIVGLVIGVFLFAEGYPALESIYKAENWGYVRIFETLGLSQGVFAFLLTTVAIVAFWAVTFVEKRVNKDSNLKPIPVYVTLSIIAIIIGFSTIFLPDRRESLLAKVEKSDVSKTADIELITPDELTLRLIRNDKTLQIIDFRKKEDIDSITLPNSLPMKIEEMFDKDSKKILSKRSKDNIFVCYDGSVAKKAALLGKELGYDNIMVLEGGFNLLKNEIINFKDYSLSEKKPDDTHRFRAEASLILNEKIAEAKKNKAGSETKKSKRVIGGC